MSVLSDRDIADEIREGRLKIEPINLDDIQPASVDLHLGRQFKFLSTGPELLIDPRGDLSRVSVEAMVYEDEDDSIIIPAGTFCLAGTVERVEIPDDLVARLDGRSSLGRLGLLVHATAGYIDPGFKGTLTLELTNQAPLAIRLYPGMRIAQLSFAELTTPAIRPYGSPGLGSKYQEQDSVTDSRVHLDKELR